MNTQSPKTPSTPPQQYAAILTLARKIFKCGPHSETDTAMRMAVQCSLAVMEKLHPELNNQQLATIAGLHPYNVTALLAAHDILIESNKYYIVASSDLIQSILNHN